MRGASVAAVGALRIFRMQTFFRGEQASYRGGENADRLENNAVDEERSDIIGAFFFKISKKQRKKA